jgi:hypothetical protein
MNDSKYQESMVIVPKDIIDVLYLCFCDFCDEDDYSVKRVNIEVVRQKLDGLVTYTYEIYEKDKVKFFTKHYNSEFYMMADKEFFILEGLFKILLVENDIELFLKSFGSLYTIIQISNNCHKVLGKSFLVK